MVAARSISSEAHLLLLAEDLGSKQHPCGTHKSLTPDPGESTSSSGLQRYQACMEDTYIHASKHSYTEKQIFFKITIEISGVMAA